MASEAQRQMDTARAALAQPRVRVALLFTVIIALTLVTHWPTTRLMIEIWRESSTYGHCYLVIPVAIWMAWREAALAPTALKPLWPGLILVGATGFAWLLAELASVTVATQFAVIGMVVATVVAVFGWTWTRRLAFPLGFLFLAVPFGEGLLPLLMEWTADVTIGALRLTGIPVYREGNYFILPSGAWSVVEACSGVRYLIAAFMIGCIFAWLHYRASSKRVLFVCLALAVALVSNWLRAYTIVLLGHLSNNRLGTGVDHNMWGWLIFGAAMFGMFAIGLRWADGQRASEPVQNGFATARVTHVVLVVLAASLLTIAAWPVAAEWIESRVDTRPVRVEAIGVRGGWEVSAFQPTDWKPDLIEPTAIDRQVFARDGTTVGVYLGVYRGQKQGSELVNTLNQIVRSDSKQWRLVDTGTAKVRLNGEPTLVKTAVARGTNEQFLIWQWYWFGGHTTSSDVRAKLQLAWQRLTGASDTASWVAIYTSVGDDIGPAARRLNAFVETMSGSIDDALEVTASR